MFFLKKVILGIAAFVFILWGGAGTQSNNILIQGGGFIGLIIGLVILYIFTKMAWRAMGCLPSFLIFSGIVCFIIYAIGGFNNGFTNIGRNIKNQHNRILRAKTGNFDFMPRRSGQSENSG